MRRHLSFALAPVIKRHPMTWRALWISFFSYMASYEVESTIHQFLQLHGIL
jgi:hypothetical protein